MGQKKLKYLVLPSAIASASFIFYYWLLTKDPIITGMDGPYYLIQVEALLRGGEMAYGDPPLIFYLSAALARAVGDVRLGVCLAVSLMVSLSAIPSYLLLRNVCKMGSIPASAGAIALTFSPQLVRMSGDLMKNASGIFFLLLSLYYTDKSAHEEGWLSPLLAALAGYLAFLTHSLDFAFSLFFIISYSLAFFLLSGKARRDNLLRLLSIATVVLGSTTITALLLPRYFEDVNKGLAFIKDVLAPDEGARMGVPLRRKQPRTWPGVFFLDIGYLIPFLLAGILLLGYYAANRKRREYWREIPLLFSAVLACLLGMLPSLLGLREWAWRFLLMEFVPVSIVAGITLSATRERQASLALAILIVSPIVLQALQATYTVRPSITKEEYEDLLMLRPYLSGSSYRILCPMSRMSRYWPEYILGYPKGEIPRYLLVCGEVRPPPVWAPVFKGNELALYERRK